MLVKVAGARVGVAGSAVDVGGKDVAVAGAFVEVADKLVAVGGVVVDWVEVHWVRNKRATAPTNNKVIERSFILVSFRALELLN